MKVAAIQSSYIPWKGYFDIIRSVDTFIFLDDVQYTVRDWRSRNRIKTRQGLKWLSVPVGNDTRRLIHEVAIPDAVWQEKHWKALVHAYSKTPYFSHYAALIEEFYRGRIWSNLSEMNQWFTRTIARECLGITTRFCDSREFSAEGRKLDRLIDLVRKCGASAYLSGPSAQEYIIDERFAEAGIALAYKDYSGYPEYPQTHGSFEHAVSILDLLFHVGPEAPRYIWGWREEGGA
ncbi:WbqC family protein [Oleiagrimonas soli]|uniref:WbqC-like protein n=1 Tax=Oleiagrimonas soli TaxID=1543381 RepID=A0A099CZ00_9GAMM|nr:WbqC family protein [Oleiagrimonas soli]KGI78891.1 hypothetical protein LF63_0102925 [Oleiagrimonas soli]MBB6184301.1 hypothetical protein [Oleiagrimonas soli]